MPDDWDGDNGRAPAQADINNALAFISRIPNAGVETAQTLIVGDGEVGFEWKTKKHYLEISFMDGEISFFGDLPNGGGRVSGGGVCAQTAPPEKLRRLMDTVFGG